MRAIPGACIKPGCLARRPLCYKVNLPESYVTDIPPKVQFNQQRLLTKAFGVLAHAYIGFLSKTLLQDV